MAKKYQVNFMVRLANRMTAAVLRGNSAPPGTYLLTVHGRKTGKAYTAPVRLIEHDGKRWLVAPYGVVNWVKNARAAGEVSLYRNKVNETVKLRELGPQESAPILKEYITKESIVRPYFDIPPEASLEEFAAVAARHPVFLLGEK